MLAKTQTVLFHKVLLLYQPPMFCCSSLYGKEKHELHVGCLNIHVVNILLKAIDT